MNTSSTKTHALLYAVGILATIGLLCAAYVWMALTWSYSTGNRVGYLQKMSRKGWICKTWEGELSMVAMPGTAPEKFLFTVQDATVAAAVEKAMGSRVALLYEQHKGIPSSCFGETEYFVVGVKPE
jgi:hypothetical protein